MDEQDDDQAHRLSRGPQPSERRLFGGREHLVAYCAQKLLVLP